MAGQPGDRQSQGVHRQRLQHRRRRRCRPRVYTRSRSRGTHCGASASRIRSTPTASVAPRDAEKTNGKICGGSIAFGGGVPLYRGQDAGRRPRRQRRHGLRRPRDRQAHPPPRASSIPRRASSPTTSRYSSVDGPSPFAHPLCAEHVAQRQEAGRRSERRSGYRIAGRLGGATSRASAC